MDSRATPNCAKRQLSQPKTPKPRSKKPAPNIILLDPNAPALQTWHLLTGYKDSNRVIETTLQALGDLVKLPEATGKCEIRLSEVFLPFSVFAIDLAKQSGSMNVEFHSYRRSIDERPHVCLVASDDPYWFEYYRRQFEDAWADATPWTPFAQEMTTKGTGETGKAG